METASAGIQAGWFATQQTCHQSPATVFASTMNWSPGWIRPSNSNVVAGPRRASPSAARTTAYGVGPAVGRGGAVKARVVVAGAVV
jgi:hypothetical protein